MSEPSRRQQARSDRIDNRRVFVFGIAVAVIVMTGALLYVYAVDKRAEGRSPETSPPAAQVQGSAQTPPVFAPNAPSK